MIRFWRAANAFGFDVGRGTRRGVSIFTRNCGRRFEWEWYSYNGVRWLCFGWTSPVRHAWWALTIYIRLS